MNHLEKQLVELKQEYISLADKYERVCSENQMYKARFLALKQSATESIENCMKQMNELVDENRLLIRKSFRDLPDEFRKVLKVTDEYLRVRSEMHRLVEQVERCTTKIVRQEIRIGDLESDVRCAKEILSKFSIDWSPMSDEFIQFADNIQLVADTRQKEAGEEAGDRAGEVSSVDSSFFHSTNDDTDDIGDDDHYGKLTTPAAIKNQRGVEWANKYLKWKTPSEQDGDTDATETEPWEGGDSTRETNKNGSNWSKQAGDARLTGQFKENAPGKRGRYDNREEEQKRRLDQSTGGKEEPAYLPSLRDVKERPASSVVTGYREERPRGKGWRERAMTAVRSRIRDRVKAKDEHVQIKQSLSSLERLSVEGRSVRLQRPQANSSCRPIRPDLR